MGTRACRRLRASAEPLWSGAVPADGEPLWILSIQRFYIYAEQGLSRQLVSVWIYEGQLRIEYRETLV
jgi:hypothetical protein